MAEEAKNPNAGDAENPDAAQAQSADLAKDSDEKAANLSQREEAQGQDATTADRPQQVANPAAGEAGTPSVTRAQAPDTSSPEASKIPSSSKPDEDSTGPEKNPKSSPNLTEGVEAGTPASKTAKGKAAAAGDKPAAKAKKEKPPAPEDKPFQEFITQEFMPNLEETLKKLGIEDLVLQFRQQKLPVRGVDQEDCWQVIGLWQGGDRKFHIGFSKEDITGPKFFCAADNGAKPSTLESFMIDERRVTMDLMVFYVVQRLNGQKWLVRN